MGGMVAPWRNTLAKSKLKHITPSHNNDNSKKNEYVWHGGPLKKYPRQVEALKNGQLTLSIFGPFLWGALFAPLFNFGPLG